MVDEDNCDDGLPQITVGELIRILENLPKNSLVDNLIKPHSYRGWYEHLAFQRADGKRPAVDLLQECRECVGRDFYGYKGGTYTCTENTPVWVANNGETGAELTNIGVSIEYHMAHSNESQ